MGNIIFGLLFFIPVWSHAEENGPKDVVPLKPIFGLEVSSSGGYGISYGKVMADKQLSLAAGFHFISREFGIHNGGNSAGAQYYKEKFIEKGGALFVRGSWDWNTGDMNNPGWYLTADAGIQRTKIEFSWGRYDDDPGFFHAGDGFRLQESGGDSIDQTSLFLTPGIHWQFDRPNFKSWYLDFGLAAILQSNRPSKQFVNPAKGTSQDVGADYPATQFSMSLLIPL